MILVNRFIASYIIYFVTFFRLLWKKENCIYSVRINHAQIWSMLIWHKSWIWFKRRGTKFFKLICITFKFYIFIVCLLVSSMCVGKNRFLCHSAIKPLTVLLKICILLYLRRLSVLHKPPTYCLILWIHVKTCPVSLANIPDTMDYQNWNI